MAAGDRTKKIISRVRLRLQQIAQTEIQTEEIIDFGNEIQTDMMVRLKCNENPITVDLSEDEQSYDLEDYHGRIKEIIPSWESGEITYIDNAKWLDYKNATSTYPIYLTIFGNKAYIAPAPSADGLSIDLWVHQKMQTADMSESVDPETPAFLDFVLETGILALYRPDLFDKKYEKMIDDYKPTVHQKQNVNMQPDGDWPED